MKSSPCDTGGKVVPGRAVENTFPVIASTGKAVINSYHGNTTALL